MDQTNLSESDIMKEMVAAFRAIFERHFDRVRENIRRVGSLAGISIRSGQMDLLRSAVVFLHATVEGQRGGPFIGVPTNFCHSSWAKTRPNGKSSYREPARRERPDRSVISRGGLTTVSHIRQSL